MAGFRLTTEREQNEAEAESKAAGRQSARSQRHGAWRYSHGNIVRLMRDCKGVVLSSGACIGMPPAADCPSSISKCYHINGWIVKYRTRRLALADVEQAWVAAASARQRIVLTPQR